MSKGDYFRKEEEGTGGASQEAVKTDRKEEMGEEGVKVGGRVFNLSPGML